MVVVGNTTYQSQRHVSCCIKVGLILRSPTASRPSGGHLVSNSMPSTRYDHLHIPWRVVVSPRAGVRGHEVQGRQRQHGQPDRWLAHRPPIRRTAHVFHHFCLDHPAHHQASLPKFTPLLGRVMLDSPPLAQVNVDQSFFLRRVFFTYVLTRPADSFGLVCLAVVSNVIYISRTQPRPTILYQC